MVKKNINKSQLILMVSLYVFLFFTVIIYICAALKHKPYATSVLVNQQFDFKINDKEYHDVNINSFSFETLQKGDHVLLTSKLPNAYFVNPLIQLAVHQCAINVYLDNSLIYSYGIDLFEQNKVVGSGYHYIPLSDNYMDKILTIEFYANEHNAFSKIPNVYLDTASNLHKDFFTQNRFFMAICLFLIVLGVVLIVASVPLIYIAKRFIKITYIGFTVLLAGLWYISSTYALQLFISNYKISTFIEYFSLYFMSIPFLLIIYEFRKNSLTSKFIIRCLIIIFILFNIIVWGGYLLFDFHYPKTLPILHILMIVGVAYSIISFIISIKNSLLQERIIFFGLLIAILLCGSHLVVFNLQKYFNFYLQFDFHATTIIGILFLATSMLISGFIDITHLTYEAAEASILEDMAYTDYLTRLSNLAKCQRYLDLLDTQKDTYEIISFDLDNLKTTNDTYGHNQGDLLIQSFANILSKVFSKHGQIGRIGGDEFLVILPNIEHDMTNTLISELSSEIKKHNDLPESKNINITMSYGCANSKEPNAINNIKVREIADMRMYEMKSAHKHQSS